MESDSTLSVTASRCCHNSLLSAPSAAGLPPHRAASDASTRTCDVLKFQTTSCCCQLLWPRIFIRETQLSCPEPGISLRPQVGSDKTRSYSVPWAGSWHWDLLPWDGYFVHVVLFHTEGSATRSVLGLHVTDEEAEAESNDVTCPRTRR